MAFTGQLNDLALSELIEFFCNQRKTGRLKVDYALAPGVFFIKDGDLVDAKVGALNGTEAVFFALTLPSASFDFSAGMQSSRRTITESWASVVLEGLRRIDEGIMPDASQAFATEEEIDEATIEYLNCIETAKEEAAAARGASKDSDAADNSFPLPMSQTLEATSASGSKRKFVFAGVAAALVLVCLVAAVPLSRRFTRANASATPAAPAATQSASDAANAQGDNNAAASPAASTDPDATAAAAADTAAAEAAREARREREARLERLRKLEAKKDAAAQASNEENAPDAAAPKPAPLGPKSVRVSVSYDEAGRVTQTSVVGASPGAEAYASTAVRVARGRRFPAGKAGSAVVTIPIN
ncbi:MAG TPA: DUF4388 domain-containing protein [Pyrinomonadaceae bacterium]|jgi:hypothetical protein|nr:DUF4388 domain-containing protein [Pyrinomonadaceae bacterium]